MKIEMTPEILEKIISISHHVCKIFNDAFDAGFASMSDCEIVNFYRFLCAREISLSLRDSVDEAQYNLMFDEALKNDIKEDSGSGL